MDFNYGWENCGKLKTAVPTSPVQKNLMKNEKNQIIPKNTSRFIESNSQKISNMNAFSIFLWASKVQQKKVKEINLTGSTSNARKKY
jgi:hypothetical protein